ncbi:MAG: hypothetical protein SXA11_05735 [Cyanobacteriota bacterium]|nr:hypothetical protein [Cyanobacteriota bacterium]
MLNRIKMGYFCEKKESGVPGEIAAQSKYILEGKLPCATAFCQVQTILPGTGSIFRNLSATKRRSPFTTAIAWVTQQAWFFNPEGDRMPKIPRHCLILTTALVIVTSSIENYTSASPQLLAKQEEGCKDEEGNSLIPCPH